MPTEISPHQSPVKRILGRVAPDDFFGRSVELLEIMSLAPHASRRRGLLLLAAPNSGMTELLRQAYDRLFAQRGGATPIYFSWSHAERTSPGAARNFLHTFLSQFVAHRRSEPALVPAPYTMSDLADLAIPSDAEWIEKLLRNYDLARNGSDERTLVRLCLSAPQYAAAHGTRTVVLFDDMHAIDQLEGKVDVSAESARLSASAATPFVYAGLRRRLLDVLNGELTPHRLDNFGTLHVEGLGGQHARSLVEGLAFSLGVAISDEVRDLIVQQLAGSPLLLSAYLQAAHDKGCALENYLSCQRLYVDELLGGRLHRRLQAVLEELAPATGTRRALLRTLHESALTSGAHKSPAETWRKKLDLGAEPLFALMTRLHMYELASFNATLVEVNPGLVWRDYLRANYRLQITHEPRALVVAETLTETLKRAPQTMERQYRRESAPGLAELLSRFDNQRVPSSLLHYNRFARLYRGMPPEQIAAGLDAETELLRLPQIVHTASGESFDAQFRQLIDEERCVIAHGFDANGYTDAGEVVWVAAEIESKVEAGRAITDVWCGRFTQLAQTCGFGRVRFWLVAPHGFSPEASELLAEREVLNSSRRQLELLTARLAPGAADGAPAPEVKSANELELVIPMGGDTELIAAQTVEQIARRLNFQPEAINQIKTALVEACINAAEYSLSPDRKIYQRFRVEDDKLVVIVSSRGVAVPALAANGADGGDEARGRRGWGLKLIRSLMDEVEFERVDDGTRLRMAKYLPR